MRSIVCLVRTVSILNLMVMSRYCACADSIADELRQIEDKLGKMTRRLHNRNIENFVLNRTVQDLQAKVGEYQDEDRRTLVQINGLPYLEPEHLYKVLESLAKTLNVSIKDEDITMLQSMSQFTDHVFKKTGRKVYPILLGLKTRNIKWRWTQGLRGYLDYHKIDYKRNGLTINMEMDGELYTYSEVTLHEHLGPRKRILFKKIKKRCTEMNFMDMWFNDTQIYVKKRSHNKALLIQDIEDMYHKITTSHWTHDQEKRFQQALHIPKNKRSFWINHAHDAI
uniref:Uncharacterized protein n=1 Tax=Cacopsylla melanoneura TaxID=428564 RepID=A0A8D9AXJ6_9HEMI